MPENRHSPPPILHCETKVALPYPHRHCFHHSRFAQSNAGRRHRCQDDQRSPSPLWLPLSFRRYPCPTITLDWHVGRIAYRLGLTNIVGLKNRRWTLESTPAFFGAGMLSRLDTSWGVSHHSVIFYREIFGVISQSVEPSWCRESVSNGDCSLGFFYSKAVATSFSLAHRHRRGYHEIHSEEFPPLSTTSLNLNDPKAFLEIPSPRYWLLCPSVLIASLPSFTNTTFINALPPLICNHSQIWAVRSRNSNFAPQLSPATAETSAGILVQEGRVGLKILDRVLTSQWTGRTFIGAITSITIITTPFYFSVGGAILALIHTFLFVIGV